jgi:hypothetical protein
MWRASARPEVSPASSLLVEPCQLLPLGRVQRGEHLGKGAHTALLHPRRHAPARRGQEDRHRATVLPRPASDEPGDRQAIDEANRGRVRGVQWLSHGVDRPAVQEGLEGRQRRGRRLPVGSGRARSALKALGDREGKSDARFCVASVVRAGTTSS